VHKLFVHCAQSAQWDKLKIGGAEWSDERMWQKMMDWEWSTEREWSREWAFTEMCFSTEWLFSASHALLTCSACISIR